MIPQPQHQPSNASLRSRADSSTSNTSSTSSSLLNISRKSRGFGIRSFFASSSGSKKKKKRRAYRSKNYSSSSVDSDLAYGKGYIPRSTVNSPRLSPGRPSYRDGSTPALGPDGRPALRRGQTDEEILELGRQLSLYARAENDKDLKRMGRSRPSQIAAGVAAISKLSRHNTSDSQGFRGTGSSKPGRRRESDDSDWESASDDDADSSDDYDGGLAYGSAQFSSTHLPQTRPPTHTAGPTIVSQPPPEEIRPPNRKASAVDPAMFGPVNSLRGYVNTPCGFRPGDYQPPEPLYEPHAPAHVPQSNSASIEANRGSQQPMRVVYPVPTSDPGRFDAARSAVSGYSQHPQDGPVTVSRPAPVVIQAPKPMVPVSTRVLEARRMEDERNREPVREDRRRSSGTGLAGVAVAGAAAAAIGGAVLSSGRDKRDREEGARRFEDEREAARKREKEARRAVEEREREARRLSEERALADREFEKRRLREGKDVGKRDDKKIADEEKAEKRRDSTKSIGNALIVDERVAEAKRKEERRRERRERQRRELEEVQAEIEREKARLLKEGKEIPIIAPSEPPPSRKSRRKETDGAERSAPAVDPFQFQVADDAFQTPQFATPARPLTPAVMTVEREPSWDDNLGSSERLSRKDSYEQEQARIQAVVDETEHSTIPAHPEVIAAVIAAANERDHRRTRDAEPTRDPIEEANRWYRLKKEAEREEESRSRSPEPSVLEKYHDEGDDGAVRIVTPPSMDHQQDKGKYDGPNADVRIDHVITPRELPMFRVPPTSLDPNREAPPMWKSRDPSCERERPLLNLVRPTPAPTPLPERQEQRGKDDSEHEPVEEKARESERSRAPGPSVVMGPRGEVRQAPPDTPTSKSVTWGENDTKHYNPSSPDRTAEEREAAEKIKSVLGNKKKSGSGWGELAAAFAAAAAAGNLPGMSSKPAAEEEKRERRDVAEEKRRSALPREGERKLSDSPIGETGMVSASPPRTTSVVDDSDQPPQPGPKPPSPSQYASQEQMPGAFGDDLDFAAHLAAGLESSGFDPNIVIEDPTYRKRDSPPGSNRFKGKSNAQEQHAPPPRSGTVPYQRPFAETVSDLGVVDEPVAHAEPREQGFVIGEVPDTPASEQGAPAEEEWEPTPKSKKGKKSKRNTLDSAEAESLIKEEPIREPEFEPKLTKKEQKKRDKAARLRELDDESSTAREPDVAAAEEWMPKLSKKEQKKRDRAARDEGSSTPRETEPESVTAEPDDEWTKEKGKKGKKRDKTNPRDDRDEEIVRMPETGSVVSAPEDDGADTRAGKKDKKKKKRGSTRDDELPTPREIDLERVDTDPRDEEWADARFSQEDKKRGHGAEREESFTSGVLVSEPTAIEGDEAWEESKPSKKDKKGKKKRKSGSAWAETEEAATPSDDRSVSVPVDAFSDLQRTATGDDWDTPSKKSKKKSKRDSTYDSYDSPSRSVAPSEVSVESSSKKDKKSRRKSTKDSYDRPDEGEPPDRGRDSFQPLDRDVSSLVSEPTGYERRFNGSWADEVEEAESVVSAPPASDSKDRKKRGTKSSKDEKSSKEEKRSSGGIFGLFKGTNRGGSETAKNSDDKEKQSFLANAGTLGAGAGLAGAAALVSALVGAEPEEDARPKATRGTSGKEDHHPPSPSTSAAFGAERSITPPGRARSISLGSQLVDPEIVQRVIKPAIDPQYGDLLPLPPSAPGSPDRERYMELEDELPALPESRPDTPPSQQQHERTSMSAVKTHVRRRSALETPTKSPSQTAIPIHFRIGQRSMPPSPGMARSSPLHSPSTSTHEMSSTPRPRSRPNSWGRQMLGEPRPLYLVEKASSGSLFTDFEDQNYPALPPSEPASNRESPAAEFERGDGDVDYLGLAPHAEPGDQQLGRPLTLDTALAALDRSDPLGSGEATPKAERGPGVDELPRESRRESVEGSLSMDDTFHSAAQSPVYREESLDTAARDAGLQREFPAAAEVAQPSAEEHTPVKTGPTLRGHGELFDGVGELPPLPASSGTSLADAPLEPKDTECLGLASEEVRPAEAEPAQAEPMAAESSSYGRQQTPPMPTVSGLWDTSPSHSPNTGEGDKTGSDLDIAAGVAAGLFGTGVVAALMHEDRSSGDPSFTSRGGERLQSSAEQAGKALPSSSPVSPSGSIKSAEDVLTPDEFNFVTSRKGKKGKKGRKAQQVDSTVETAEDFSPAASGSGMAVDDVQARGLATEETDIASQVQLAPSPEVSRPASPPLTQEKAQGSIAPVVEEEVVLPLAPLERLEASNTASDSETQAPLSDEPPSLSQEETLVIDQTPQIKDSEPEQTDADAKDSRPLEAEEPLADDIPGGFPETPAIEVKQPEVPAQAIPAVASLAGAFPDTPAIDVAETEGAPTDVPSSEPLPGGFPETPATEGTGLEAPVSELPTVPSQEQTLVEKEAPGLPESGPGEAEPRSAQAAVLPPSLSPHPPNTPSVEATEFDFPAASQPATVSDEFPISEQSATPATALERSITPSRPPQVTERSIMPEARPGVSDNTDATIVSEDSHRRDVANVPLPDGARGDNSALDSRENEPPSAPPATSAMPFSPSGQGEQETTSGPTVEPVPHTTNEGLVNTALSIIPSVAAVSSLLGLGKDTDRALPEEESPQAPPIDETCDLSLVEPAAGPTADMQPSTPADESVQATHDAADTATVFMPDQRTSPQEGDNRSTDVHGTDSPRFPENKIDLDEPLPQAALRDATAPDVSGEQCLDPDESYTSEAMEKKGKKGKKGRGKAQNDAALDVPEPSSTSQTHPTGLDSRDVKPEPQDTTGDLDKTTAETPCDNGDPTTEGAAEAVADDEWGLPAKKGKKGKKKGNKSQPALNVKEPEPAVEPHFPVPDEPDTPDILRTAQEDTPPISEASVPAKEIFSADAPTENPTEDIWAELPDKKKKKGKKNRQKSQYSWDVPDAEPSGTSTPLETADDSPTPATVAAIEQQPELTAPEVGKDLPADAPEEPAPEDIWAGAGGKKGKKGKKSKKQSVTDWDLESPATEVTADLGPAADEGKPETQEPTQEPNRPEQDTVAPGQENVEATAEDIWGSTSTKKGKKGKKDKKKGSKTSSGVVNPAVVEAPVAEEAAVVEKSAADGEAVAAQESPVRGEETRTVEEPSAIAAVEGIQATGESPSGEEHAIPEEQPAQDALAREERPTQPSDTLAVAPAHEELPIADEALAVPGPTTSHQPPDTQEALANECHPAVELSPETGQPAPAASVEAVEDLPPTEAVSAADDAPGTLLLPADTAHAAVTDSQNLSDAIGVTPITLNEAQVQPVEASTDDIWEETSKRSKKGKKDKKKRQSTRDADAGSSTTEAAAVPEPSETAEQLTEALPDLSQTEAAALIDDLTQDLRDSGQTEDPGIGTETAGEERALVSELVGPSAEDSWEQPTSGKKGKKGKKNKNKPTTYDFEPEIPDTTYESVPVDTPAESGQSESPQLVDNDNQPEELEKQPPEAAAEDTWAEPSGKKSKKSKNKGKLSRQTTFEEPSQPEPVEQAETAERPGILEETQPEPQGTSPVAEEVSLKGPEGEDLWAETSTKKSKKGKKKKSKAQSFSWDEPASTTVDEPQVLEGTTDTDAQEPALESVDKSQEALQQEATEQETTADGAKPNMPTATLSASPQQLPTSTMESRAPHPIALATEESSKPDEEVEREVPDVSQQGSALEDKEVPSQRAETPTPPEASIGPRVENGGNEPHDSSALPAEETVEGMTDMDLASGEITEHAVNRSVSDEPQAASSRSDAQLAPVEELEISKDLLSQEHEDHPDMSVGLASAAEIIAASVHDTREKHTSDAIDDAANPPTSSKAEALRSEQASQAETPELPQPFEEDLSALLPTSPASISLRRSKRDRRKRQGSLSDSAEVSSSNEDVAWTPDDPMSRSPTSNVDLASDGAQPLESMMELPQSFTLKRSKKDKKKPKAMTMPWNDSEPSSDNSPSESWSTPPLPVTQLSTILEASTEDLPGSIDETKRSEHVFDAPQQPEVPINQYRQVDTALYDQAADVPKDYESDTSQRTEKPAATSTEDAATPVDTPVDDVSFSLPGKKDKKGKKGKKGKKSQPFEPEPTDAEEATPAEPEESEAGTPDAQENIILDRPEEAPQAQGKEDDFVAPKSGKKGKKGKKSKRSAFAWDDQEPASESTAEAGQPGGELITEEQPETRKEARTDEREPAAESSAEAGQPAGDFITEEEEPAEAVTEALHEDAQQKKETSPTEPQPAEHEGIREITASAQQAPEAQLDDAEAVQPPRSEPQDATEEPSQPAPEFEESKQADDEWALPVKKSKKAKKGKKPDPAMFTEPETPSGTSTPVVQDDLIETAEPATTGEAGSEESAPIDVKEPDVTEPEVVRPEAAEPAADPQVLEHEVAEPEVAQEPDQPGPSQQQVQAEDIWAAAPSKKKSKKDKKKRASKAFDSEPSSGTQTPAQEEPDIPATLPEDMPAPETEEAAEVPGVAEAETPAAAEEAASITEPQEVQSEDVWEPKPSKKSKKDKKRKGSKWTEVETPPDVQTPLEVEMAPEIAEHVPAEQALSRTVEDLPPADDAEPEAVGAGSEAVDAQIVPAEPEVEAAAEPEPEDMWALPSKESKKDKKRKTKQNAVELLAGAAALGAVPDAIDLPARENDQQDPSLELTEVVDKEVAPDDLWEAPAKKSKKGKKNASRSDSAISTPAPEAEVLPESTTTAEDTVAQQTPAPEAEVVPAGNTTADQLEAQQTPAEAVSEQDVLPEFSPKSRKDKKKKKKGNQLVLSNADATPSSQQDQVSESQVQQAANADSPENDSAYVKPESQDLPEGAPASTIEVNPAVLGALRLSPDHGLKALLPTVETGDFIEPHVLYPGDTVSPKLLTGSPPPKELLGAPTEAAETGPEVDMTLAGESSRVSHSPPFESATQRKRAKTIEADQDAAEETAVAAPDSAASSLDEKSQAPAEDEPEGSRDMAASYLEDKSTETAPDVTLTNEPMLTATEPELSPRDIAAAVLEAGPKVLLSPEAKPDTEEPEVDKSRTQDPPTPEARQLAASWLEHEHEQHHHHAEPAFQAAEDVPGPTEEEPPKPPSPRPTGSEDVLPEESTPSSAEAKRRSTREDEGLGTEAAAAAGAVAGGVSLLAEKFGGSKKKKGKKKKQVDKRTTREDDPFDDPALWEGADRRPLEGSRMDENADGFWDVPDTVEGDNTKDKVEDKAEGKAEDKDTDMTGGNTAEQGGLRLREIVEDAAEDYVESPTLGRRASERKREAEQRSKARQEDDTTDIQPAQRVFSFPDDIAYEDVSTPVTPAPVIQRELVEDNIDDLSPVAPSAHHMPSIPDLRRSAPSLPPVEEESAEETVPEKPLARQLTRTPEVNRDSGFLSDSPAPHRGSHRFEDDSHRDSGVHLKDWPESTSPHTKDSRVFGAHPPRTPGSNLRESLAHDQHETADRYGTAAGSSETGRDTPRGRGQAITLHEPSPPARTPEPQKSLAKKRTARQLGTLGNEPSPERSGGAALTPMAMGRRVVSDNSAIRQYSRSPVETRRSASNTSMVRHHTPEPLNLRPDTPGSIRSLHSATPPLRRVDKRLSGDLRSVSLSQRSTSELSASGAKTDSDKHNKDAAAAAAGLGVAAGAAALALTASNNSRASLDTTPVANEGRVRTKDMADVYVSSFSVTLFRCSID